jgi:hypothetical protein
MRKSFLRLLIVGGAAAASLVVASATAFASSGGEADPITAPGPHVVAPKITKISHAQAISMLSASGITWSSSGGCSDRNNPTCTSFDQVNLETIQGAQTLKSSSGCGLNVTGGTEVGHADGTYSHYNGYKLDMSKNTCLNNYVLGNFTSIGGGKWQSPAGNVYYDENNHWDITFYNCGGC